MATTESLIPHALLRRDQSTPAFSLGALNHHVRSLTFPRPSCREDVKPHREATSGQLNYSLSPGVAQAWAPHTRKREAAADSRPQATTWASLRVTPWAPGGVVQTAAEVHADRSPDPQTPRVRRNTRFRGTITQQELETCQFTKRTVFV